MTRLVIVGSIVHRADCRGLLAASAIPEPWPRGSRLAGAALRDACTRRGLAACTTCRPLATGGAR